MSDFTTESPEANDLDYWEFDPGPEVAEKAGDRDFSVPKAWYPMVVSKFDKTASKAGNPMYVIEFSCNEGSAKSRYTYKMYQTLTNNNAVAKLLSALGCEKTATGAYKVQPSKFLKCFWSLNCMRVRRGPNRKQCVL